MLEVAVRYEERQATVRFEPDKVRLEQILKRFAQTRFTVNPVGGVVAFLRQEKATLKAWAEPARLAPGGEAAVLVEIAPAQGARVGAASAVATPAPGLKFAKDAEEASAAPRRLRVRVSPDGTLKSGEVAVRLQVRYAVGERSFTGEIAAPLLIGEAEERLPVLTGVALVGGSLEATLGHLCDQKGCVDHFHRSLQGIAGLAGVRVRAGAATLYLRAGQAVDVGGLRERLRDQGVEIRRLSARDLGPAILQVELRRWGKGAAQCLACLERAAQAVGSVAWAGQAAAAEGGLRIRLAEGEPDLAALLDALDRKGLAPAAVWLVPEGTAVPPPAAPAVAAGEKGPRKGGLESHPRIAFEVDHECAGGLSLAEALARQPWASRTEAAVAAVGDRQYAELSALFRELRAAGRRPGRIRLSGFGQLRLQCDFAHLCGEVEFSKPPDPSKEKKPPEGEPKKPLDSAQGKEEPKKEEPKKEVKPFVPQPLRPAPSSPARRAIEKALAGLPWIGQAKYLEYHTKPEFSGPRKLWISLVPAREEDVRPDELVRVLTEAGFPPTAVRVSRSFPGLGFGEPLPGDLELVRPGGERCLLSSLRRPGRPLAVGFVSLACPKWDKYKYEADPKFYAPLKRSLEALKDRADFVAISSNPEDPYPKAVEFWERLGMPIPLLLDAGGKARACLNAQVTPPPHWFLFDGEGVLRYAGDAHDGWEKAPAAPKEYLADALERVLAGKLTANGAVFFNSTKCNCSHPGCTCPKCGCGSSCRCAIKHCKVGF